MTKYICIYIYISHPPVSEGDYPHLLKPTLFVGFIPVTRFGEAAEGKSRSATLLGLSLRIMSALPTCQMACRPVIFCVKSVQTQQGWHGAGVRIKPRSQKTHVYASVLAAALHWQNGEKQWYSSHGVVLKIKQDSISGSTRSSARTPVLVVICSSLDVSDGWEPVL